LASTAAGLAGVVGAGAEDSLRLGLGQHRGVDLRVVGGGHDVPRPVDVAGLEAARDQGQLGTQALEGGRDLGGHHDHVGARGDQGRHPALGDLSPADHQHPATGQAQPHGVRRRLGRGATGRVGGRVLGELGHVPMLTLEPSPRAR
jgi:hypothetical protein